MYITITPQNLSENFSQSVIDLVSYLEKENEGKEINDMEFFFDQNGDKISSKEVVFGIDNNIKKLKKVEPKFYSITVNPSKWELQKLNDNSKDLKKYIREIMNDYAASFNREISGRSVNVDDIKYYAKIEHERVYKNFDKAIRENAPFYSEIVKLKNKMQQLNRSKIENNSKVLTIQQQIVAIEKQAPHKINGKMIVRGMQKEGSQSHVHIIVSRKDITNSYSLSPGSRYKSSDTVFNGKQVKRGFDRDQFFGRSEKTFDSLFGYQRNYVETYHARKTFIKHPEKYIAAVMGLSINEKIIAVKILNQSGLSTAALNIPTNKVQLAIKTFKKLKKGLDIAIRSSSIGV